MDLVRHHLQIQGISGDWIGVLRLMAQHAHVDALRIAAVERQRIVASVAARSLDHVARHRNGGPVRNKIEGRASVIRAEVVRGQIAIARDSDGCRRRGVEPRRGLRRESVLILARA